MYLRFLTLSQIIFVMFFAEIGFYLLKYVIFFSENFSIISYVRNYFEGKIDVCYLLKGRDM